MKTIILHGEDVTKINLRMDRFITVAKKRNWNIAVFDKETKMKLSEVISAADLFNDQRLVVVKDFQKVKITEKKWLLKNIEKYSGVLVVKSITNLTESDIKYFPKQSKIEKFEIPKKIFNFLDSFYPGNSKSCILLFHEVLTNYPVEFIFTLLAKTLRDLYWVTIDPSNISYPSWRVAKLEYQAEKFKLSDIRQFIKRASEIDIEVKTSKSDLSDSIDLLILSQLK